jgi:hypothetical protein
MFLSNAVPRTKSFKHFKTPIDLALNQVRDWWHISNALIPMVISLGELYGYKYEIAEAVEILDKIQDAIDNALDDIAGFKYSSILIKYFLNKIPMIDVWSSAQIPAAMGWTLFSILDDKKDLKYIFQEEFKKYARSGIIQALLESLSVNPPLVQTDNKVICSTSQDDHTFPSIEHIIKGIDPIEYRQRVEDIYAKYLRNISSSDNLEHIYGQCGQIYEEISNLNISCGLWESRESHDDFLTFVIAGRILDNVNNPALCGLTQNQVAEGIATQIFAWVKGKNSPYILPYLTE